MTPIVYLDMDGVLADLYGAIKQATGLENIKDDRSKFFKSLLPEHVTRNGFETQGVLPKAYALVDMLIDIQRDKEKAHRKLNIGILTSCGKFYDPISEVTRQKKAWIERNFAELSRVPFCTTTSGKDKAQLANKHAFLIDDHAPNVHAFMIEGGFGNVYSDVDTDLDELEIKIKNWLDQI